MKIDPPPRAYLQQWAVLEKQFVMFTKKIQVKLVCENHLILLNKNQNGDKK